jgi:Fur family ferric uptake transcriptional regulator
LRRPAHYNTKNGKAIISYLASVKDMFVTAAQIAGHLQKEQGAVSRPTIYRQLEKLVDEGKIRKFLFGGMSSCFQYVDPDEFECEYYHLKCEVCEGIFDLKCDEVEHVSRHIFEDHAFQVDDKKTVFYGKCKTCLRK